VNAILEEKASLERYIIALKAATPEERSQLLDSISVTDGKVDLLDVAVPDRTRYPSEPAETSTGQVHVPDPEGANAEISSDDEDYDPSNFLSVNECGQIGFYGPSSALHGPSPRKPSQPLASRHSEPIRNQLIAHAAIERQKEHALSRLPMIGGEPSELALHLLDLHWNRQHHTFLLTYRPAIMRDLVDGGPCCSEFLLSAIFACVSKFSDRTEVRDSPTEPETAGRRFFLRCENMLGAALGVSTIPTVVALLLLGGTFNARGQTSKGWLYTGYALRMVRLQLRFEMGII
jgi:hypothetical protein